MNATPRTEDPNAPSCDDLPPLPKTTALPELQHACTRYAELIKLTTSTLLISQKLPCHTHTICIARLDRASALEDITSFIPRTTRSLEFQTEEASEPGCPAYQGEYGILGSYLVGGNPTSGRIRVARGGLMSRDRLGRKGLRIETRKKGMSKFLSLVGILVSVWFWIFASSSWVSLVC